MARSVRVVGKVGNLTIEAVEGNWGPLPIDWGADSPLKEEEAQVLARRALYRLVVDARYFLGDGDRKIPDEYRALLGCVPSSRKAFERALAGFHQRIDDALLGRGNPSYLHWLADEIAILEDRRELPPLPRGKNTKRVIGECFARLWIDGENWLTRREFFKVCCTELKAQAPDCPPTITQHHFIRILKEERLDKYFPPMRRRGKRRKRLNGSIDS